MSIMISYIIYYVFALIKLCLEFVVNLYIVGSVLIFREVVSAKESVVPIQKEDSGVLCRLECHNIINVGCIYNQ